MSRESEAYRDNLEALIAFFGERRLLTAADVGRYTGRNPRTVKEHYDIPKGGITVQTLARRMSK